MRKLSDCRVLLMDDAKANLDILVERLKPDHKLSIGKRTNYADTLGLELQRLQKPCTKIARSL